jgi:hypothetical protein
MSLRHGLMSLIVVAALAVVGLDLSGGERGVAGAAGLPAGPQLALTMSTTAEAAPAGHEVVWEARVVNAGRLGLGR